MTWTLLVLLLPAAWAGTALWLDRGGRVRPARRYDALVVAGCRVHADGRPSVALARRVDLAIELWTEGVAPRIVLTGGVGRDAPISEARAAADRCVARGVPADALVLEEESTSTYENALFAARLLRGEVLVVSDAAHAFRCRRVFARHFAAADAIGAVPASSSARVRLALREALAVWRHGVLGRL